MYVIHIFLLIYTNTYTMLTVRRVAGDGVRDSAGADARRWHIYNVITPYLYDGCLSFDLYI